jgi:hypothetical protein
MGVSSKCAQPELITAHPIRDGSFLRNSSVIGTAPHKARYSSAALSDADRRGVDRRASA